MLKIKRISYLKTRFFSFSSEINHNIHKKKTHYEFLEVENNAKSQQIRENYLKLGIFAFEI